MIIIGERIRARIRETTFSLQAHELHVTVSVGCATYPLQTTDRDQLFSSADQALYRYKQSGRNRVMLAV